MNEQKFYDFLQKQMLLLIGWSMLTGLGFTLLCVYHGIADEVYLWYAVVFLVSLGGVYLYRQFKYVNVKMKDLDRWYSWVKLFIYVMFGLWTVLFILYSGETTNNLHLVTVFTQIGASVIASTFLFSDKKLFVPILLILMYPLVIYFTSIHEAYAYFLSGYSIVFLGLLLYSSNNSNQLIQQIYYQAQHDSLTALYNRRYFTDYLEQMLLSLKRRNRYAYILLIDLDYFKTINDSLGHEVGDSLLTEVAHRIKVYCEDTHLIARIGGDEFMIASYEFEKESECINDVNIFAKELGEILKETYTIDYNHLHISASIGVKILDGKTTKTSQVIKEADIAMYEVKEQGRDGVVNFNNVLAKQVDNTLEIERKLYFALKNKEIELYYQPQVNDREEIVGCEVLSRWKNKELGYISPEVFIPIAEKTGIVIDIGHHILEESFKTLKKWEEEGLALEQFSINISVRQILHGSFVYNVEHLCRKYLNEDTRKKIIFEITETLLAEDISKVVQIINSIKRLDIGVSMDDFGTGYSSLSSLRELPIDELKIDRSFVSYLGERDSDRMMITTILSLAKIFNLNIVAEGVETGEQFRFLLEQGCHFFQGYYFAKPMKSDDFVIHYMRQRASKENTLHKVNQIIDVQVAI